MILHYGHALVWCIMHVLEYNELLIAALLNAGYGQVCVSSVLF